MHQRIHAIIVALTLSVSVAGSAFAVQGAAAPRATNSATFKQDGVEIVASVHAQIYTWSVTNIDAPPIMRFSIPEHNTYNQNFPPGWKLHQERGMFTASTDDERLAIHPGQTRTFDARSGSAGSMLGPVPVTLGFSTTADMVVEGIWGPVPKRRSIVVLVAVMLMLIGLLHVAALRKLEKRQQV